ncbi:T9SS type A sorting domain-containing protein [Taibaiella soli]|nr:T9SS type A sorting domain-containing protein [Taibaiella soli]
MKKLLFLLSLLPFLSKAQVNILPQTGAQNILVNTFREFGNAYYFLSYDTSLAAQDVFNNHPHQYMLNKVDKNSNVVISAVVAMGDTLQVDSVVSFNYIQLEKSPDNRIYIFYQKFIKQDFTASFSRQWKSGIYCTVFDTAMQQLVPDKRLVIKDGAEQMYAPTLQTVCFAGNNPLIGYNLFDTSSSILTIAKFFIMDAQANIMLHDTLGNKAAAAQSGEHYILKLCANKNRIAFWGSGLLPAGNWFQDYSITVLDTTLSLVDTFRSSEYNIYPNVFAYPELCTNSLLLPSGTLIQGHCAYNYPINYYTAQSVVTRRNLSHPFQMDKYLVISGKDSLDHYHGTPGPVKETIGYNVFDGNIYYANNTHADYMEDVCLTPDNYLQVICTDTNLNHKWTKYIYSGSNSCSFVDHIVPADQRSGIVLCGSNTAGQVPLAYYIDSTGSLGVSNTTQPVIRDRFNVYPNPATSKVFVDDVFDKLKRATVYAMDGRVVINQSLTSGKNELNVALLPPGLYLIRLMSKDDEVYQTKFIKE